jgi:4-amino-4-deoxy-L-arabinose transferase-like glycosyltransferase
LVLAITLPFINHAFHIDEPLFLRIAQQIKQHPLKPFGFSYLWNFRYEPLSQIAAFSPLFSYFLAAISWKHAFPPEWLIHLGIIPFAWIAVLSTYGLTRQFEFTPRTSFLAACLLLASPAFVLSANMAMPDVAAAGFGILAVVLALKGWKKDSISWLILSGLLLGIAFLMRYNAGPLMIILGLFGLTYTEGKKAWVPSAIAVIFLGLGMIPSLLSGGGSHTGEVLSIFAKLDGWQNRFWTINTHLTMATFLPFVALLAWWKRSAFFKVFLLFLAFDFALYGSTKVKWFGFFPDVFIFGLGIATFVVILLFVWEQMKKSNLFHVGLAKNESSLSAKFTLSKIKSLKGNEAFRIVLLFFWVIGILAIPIIYVHFGAKYLLLVQPPLILILFMILGPNLNQHVKYITVLLVIMLGSSLMVAKADFDYAGLYRKAAADILNKEVSLVWEGPKSPAPMVWFTGHWGWQYYWEKSGGMPLSVDRVRDGEPIAGDFVVIPKYASAFDIDELFMKRLQFQDKFTPTLSLPVRTMNNLAKAGFYSNHWGPLPFSFSWVPPEEIQIFRVKFEETKLD